jgi:hypothetical protein
VVEERIRNNIAARKRPKDPAQDDEIRQRIDTRIVTPRAGLAGA